MKVILLQSVKALGAQGDVVEVSDGYARNFLVAKGLAKFATPKALKRLEQASQAKAKVAHKEKSAFGQQAKKLDGHKVLIKEKASDEGTFYAAVTAKTIAQSLQAQGFNVKENMIKLKDAIKAPTERSVKVQLPHDFEAEVRVIIERK